ncbi:Protein OS-9 [Dispira simplex]|nr:Protein OS-9 [Dispira simplex]
MRVTHTTGGLWWLLWVGLLQTNPSKAFSKQTVFEDVLAKPAFEVLDDQRLLSDTHMTALLAYPHIHAQHLAKLITWNGDVASLLAQPIQDDPKKGIATMEEDERDAISPWYEPIPMRFTGSDRYLCFTPLSAFPDPPELEHGYTADTSPGEKDDSVPPLADPLGTLDRSASPTDNAKGDASLPLDEWSQIERGLSLLSRSPPDCVIYIQGWWTYEYCPRSHVRQYHYAKDDPPDGKKQVNFDYVLGQYSHRVPSLTTPSGELMSRGKWHPNSGGEYTSASDVGYTSLHSTDNRQFLSQEWSGGAFCDVTHKPRMVQIQYHCAPGEEEHIESVVEISVCVYVMVIRSPHLCQEPAFTAQKQPGVGHIKCHRVVTDIEYDEHHNTAQGPPHIDAGGHFQSLNNLVRNDYANDQRQGEVDTEDDLSQFMESVIATPEQWKVFKRWMNTQLGGQPDPEAWTKLNQEEQEAIRTVWQQLSEDLYADYTQDFSSGSAAGLTDDADANADYVNKVRKQVAQLQESINNAWKAMQAGRHEGHQGDPPPEIQVHQMLVMDENGHFRPLTELQGGKKQSDKKKKDKKVTKRQNQQDKGNVVSKDGPANKNSFRFTRDEEEFYDGLDMGDEGADGGDDDIGAVEAMGF